MLDLHTSAVFSDKNGISIPYSAIFAGIVKAVEVFSATKGFSLTVEDQEDITMEAACKAISHSHQYDSKKSNPATWSSRIAWNCACDALARKLRMQTKPLSGCVRVDKDGDGKLCYEEVMTYRSGDYAADKPLEEEEAEKRFSEVYNGFNDRTRRILDMTEDGLKPAKIAVVLGCTPGAVSVALCRARKHLAHELN